MRLEGADRQLSGPPGKLVCQHRDSMRAQGCLDPSTLWRHWLVGIRLPPPTLIRYHMSRQGKEILKHSWYMLRGFLNCSGKLSTSCHKPFCSFFFFWPLSKFGPWVQCSPVVLSFQLLKRDCALGLLTMLTMGLTLRVLGKTAALAHMGYRFDGVRQWDAARGGAK